MKDPSPGISSSLGNPVFLVLNFLSSSVVVIGFLIRYLRTSSSKAASILLAGGGGIDEEVLQTKPFYKYSWGSKTEHGKPNAVQKQNNLCHPPATFLVRFYTNYNLIVKLTCWVIQILQKLNYSESMQNALLKQVYEIDPFFYLCSLKTSLWDWPFLLHFHLRLNNNAEQLFLNSKSETSVTFIIPVLE